MWRYSPNYKNKWLQTICHYGLSHSANYTLSPKNVHFLFFLNISIKKSANFYNFWCTHIMDTFNNFSNFACLKFQLLCDMTIGYFRCMQFLRTAIKIRSDA